MGSISTTNCKKIIIKIATISPLLLRRLTPTTSNLQKHALKKITKQIITKFATLCLEILFFA
jgi:hypothetical protein